MRAPANKKLWERGEYFPIRARRLSKKVPQVMQTSKKFTLTPEELSQPLTHDGASVIWSNVNYDAPEEEVVDWSQFADNSDLGYTFQNLLEEFKSRHDVAAESDFSLDLFGNICVEPPEETPKYDEIVKNGQRILNAVHRRHTPKLTKFREIHDQLNAHCLFAVALKTRFPRYRLSSHPTLGGEFERLFNLAVEALEGWTDPWDKPRKRDLSPKRKAVTAK